MKNILFLLSIILPLTFIGETTSESSSPQNGDLIYLGQTDEAMAFDGAWRILDNKKTNTGEEGMFLLCEHLIGNADGSGVYFRNEESPSANTYTGSDAKKWCEDFYKTHFDENEKSYILPTYKSDEAFEIDAAIGSGDKKPKVNFDPEANILNGDRVFLLSAEEGSSEKYGLETADKRIAGYKGEAASYWLRSPHSPSFPIDVGIVFYMGWLMDFYENQNDVFGTGPIRMRPALNLSKDCLASLTKMGDGEWCLNNSSRAHASIDQSEPKPNSRATWMTIGLIALLVLIISIPIGLPILIILLVRRKKRKIKKA